MPPTMTTGSRQRSRDGQLDALRALAVIVMVGWHITDGWLDPSFRTGVGWHTVRVVGGLAAPAFLFVAGMAVASALAAGRSRMRIVFRGLAVVGLGGLLRIQNWLVDAGGMLEWRSLLPATLGIAGYGALLFASHRRDRRAWVVAAALLVTFGWRVHADVPEHAARILAVDVLSCIGASVIGAAIVGRVRGTVPVLVGAAVLCLGGALPPLVDDPWLSAWIGAPHPDGVLYARFSLVPWAGYTLLGFGLASSLRRRPRLVLGIGMLLAVGCFEGGLPWARRLIHDLPALRPVARGGFHVGALFLLWSIAMWLSPCRPLRALGRVSLPVYWVHLEIAYGLLSLPFTRASSPAWCATAATLALVISTVTAMARPRLRASVRGVLRLPTSPKPTPPASPNPRA